jgi:hypothetical protein
MAKYASRQFAWRFSPATSGSCQCFAQLGLEPHREERGWLRAYRRPTAAFAWTWARKLKAFLRFIRHAANNDISRLGATGLPFIGLAHFAIIVIQNSSARNRQKIERDKDQVKSCRDLIRRTTAGFLNPRAEWDLDLSVEKLVLRPKYASLFTMEEREQAYQRLQEGRAANP